MARMIKNTEKQIISCFVVTKFTDGTESEKQINVGDIVEGLRYVVNEEVVSLTGKVKSISTSISSVTAVNKADPQDYFSKDVIVKSITIDCSEQYESNVVVVPAREIVEDEGVLNVEMVYVKSAVKLTMDMEYTDGSIANQDLEVGDVLVDFKAMSGTPGTPDIKGDFKFRAFQYKAVNTLPELTGLYLKPLAGGDAVVVPFKNIISFTEETHADVTDPNSMASIVDALNESEDGVVFASLGVDVTVPKRDDGKITTLMVNEGKELNLDLGGHSISCQAYAFYVNGGVLNISDSTGEGKIECTLDKGSAAYPAVYVAAGGTCNMDGGLIDTTKAPTDKGPNWLYGVVCSGDGVFNMTGGEMIIEGAAGISITNGTATGGGAQFTIGGDAVITSNKCAGVYLADNKSVTIKDKAVINGGIVARMGVITLQDNAVINGHEVGDDEPLGEQVTFSGVCSPKAGLLALTGVYGSELGNDMNIVVKDNARINGKIDDAIDICTINTRYDQVVNVDIASTDNLVATEDYRVYGHDELAELATEVGRTLGPETNTTTLTIKINGEVIRDEEGE